MVKGCAGLGNRLVTVFAAIKYCIRNERKLYVAWTDGQFSKRNIDAFCQCFEISGVQLARNYFNETLQYNSLLFAKNEGLGVYDLYLDKQNTFWQKFPQRIFFLPGLKKLRRRWQPLKHGNIFNSLNYGSDLPDKLKEDVLYYIDFLPGIIYEELPSYIKLKQQIANKVDIQAMHLGINDAVGVHIRYTDKQPTRDVKNVVEHLKRTHPDMQVYLSTDSIEIEQLFLENLTHVILYPKCKPPLQGEGLHQWALYNKMEDLKSVLYEESVMEMFLLSKCKYLYYQGNSTFSNISRVYHVNKTNCYDWLQL